jgi:hypothetical protein
MNRVILIALVVLAGLAGRAVADDFFSSSPGPLSSSHGSLDAQDHCNDCHVNNSREVDNNKCLACHDHQNLGARIAKGVGFHASPKVKGKDCKTCHGEHKNRSHDIMGWTTFGNMKSFDHDLTGWQLKGAHAKTDCDKCHKKTDKQGQRVFMGTDKLCGSSGCHEKDQPHKMVRKDMLACERCHTESVWKPQRRDMQFNHDDRKDALMPLFGSHKDVGCPKCHPKDVFKLPFAKADNCGNNGCHKSSHEGQLFDLKPCEWCHSPTFKTLKQQNFDHTERTKFDLGPAHRKNKCYDCHTKALGQSKPSGACVQCHAKDSKHGQRFKEFGDPPACQTCHPSGGPKFTPSAFNHGGKTRFKLEFKHAQIACRACHRGKDPSDFEDFRGLVGRRGQIDCMGCHQHRSVHADPDHPKGRYTNDKCLQCHQHPGDIIVKRTGPIIEAAHGLNGTWPLLKKHKGVPCDECHNSRTTKGKTSFEHVEPNCNGAKQCHEDSLHEGTLGEGCQSCHTPGTWDALKFDHDKPFPKDAKGEVTAFPLKGEHKNNKCEQCHPQRKFAAAHPQCSAEGCHQDDDAHKKRLGDKCEQCHVETGDNIFNHNTMSAFRLDGKHLQVRCNDCHPSITFKPRPTDCFGCHPEPQVHRGQYGTGCAQCHTTRTWEDVKPLHDVGDFALKGMHDNIACERCHKDNRPLAGSGNLCINCHRQDDIHGNSLSPRCGECHTQWSFAPAKFDHMKVSCNLTGLHRTLACADCHKNGNFVGLAAECVACHHDDAVRAISFYSGHASATTCAQCHNSNTWLNADQTKTAQAAFGRDSVCR